MSTNTEIAALLRTQQAEAITRGDAAAVNGKMTAVFHYGQANALGTAATLVEHWGSEVEATPAPDLQSPPGTNADNTEGRP